MNGTISLKTQLQQKGHITHTEELLEHPVQLTKVTVLWGPT